MHTSAASETIAQVEHLTLSILEQIVAPSAKSRRDLGPAVGTHSHGKVEIQIADRRKSKTAGRVLIAIFCSMLIHPCRVDALPEFCVSLLKQRARVQGRSVCKEESFEH